MGAGGRMTRAEEAQRDKSISRVPTEKPPFSVGTLRKAVPPHCFNRSVLRSGSYLVVDLLIISAFVYSTTYFNKFDGLAAWSLWAAYWVVTGCVATGVWVIAHECGHHAFSDYEWVDDTVGLIFHSCLLVPYFSWKYSHRRHHSNTASVERDEVFVPKPKEAIRPTQFLLQTPPGRILQILVTLTLGWPLYLLFNVSGRKYPRFANHFDPSAPIFNSREMLFIFISDIALLTVAFGLYTLGATFGFLWLMKIYGVPLLIVNGFLVLITYLQHTHPSLPHYSGEEWDWLRGALSTVDRDYGILNHVFHHITDTHVAHHIFSTMPHYHAEEATKVLKPILGRYYQFDGTPVYKALWREMKECVYVEADPGSKGVLWYNNKL
ncbi:omega-6 fatty acid desaturase / acyl-lipid omega-6 desaturase (Delta-12 desaturase) [Marchantia polymorpha subsp. ruderalis]|uniref:Fatty acid desaturase domain-containing protein n=1 Tax=Marchantia polymorpha TaxID=3197 RepID=A0A2R6WM20_MARPO|nr:hypothetical protein MARPO_0075s0021 [Marchantia polymorpha]BBN00844.1 hypothetical protein Mp_2g02590 [Marchantia polymorpha subsp. ruderalis]|eukprot:PTQ34897.1 hypothetical protein MARPO_0075s0021 [Marchantia polymorpha]